MSVLNDDQFYALTLGPGGGASRQINTLEGKQDGDEGYMVGGKPDRSGVRIPAQYHTEAQYSPAVVDAHRQHLVRLLGVDPSGHQGSWRNPETGQIELDASDHFVRKADALKEGYLRKEWAIRDLKNRRDRRLGRRAVK